MTPTEILRTITSLSVTELEELQDSLERKLFYIKNEIKLREMSTNTY